MPLKRKNSLVPLGRNFPKFQIEEIAISHLKWNARSPRVHPEKQIAMLARNIDTFGFLHPCLISDQNRLLCGTARVLAAKRLGMETVPAVRVSHLSDEDQRAVILADAKLSGLPSGSRRYSERSCSFLLTWTSASIFPSSDSKRPKWISFSKVRRTKSKMIRSGAFAKSRFLVQEIAG